MKLCVDEIEGRLAAAAIDIPRDRAEARKRYHGSSLHNHGLPMPIQRALARNGFSFSAEPVSRQLAIWTRVWQARSSLEARVQALLFCGRHCRPQSHDLFWPALNGWAKSVDCWVDADGLAGHLSAIHETMPARVYPTLVAWNRSRDPWRRRLSIVSLLYFAGQRRRAPPARKVLALVEPLLADLDHFVQRGVGWTLRECGTVYPEETWDFLSARGPRLSAIAFSAATEKIEADRKAKLKAARKAARAGQRAVTPANSVR